MPIIMEMVLIGMVTFGLGTYLGTKAEKQEADKQTVSDGPIAFTPAEQKSLIRECSLRCGKNRFKKYDFIYGECECINKK